MNRIKICTICGTVFGSANATAYISNSCASCHSPLQEIDVDTKEFMKTLYPKGKSYNYTVDEMRQNRESAYRFQAQIFEKYIEPLGQLDTSLVAYKLNMESYGRPTDDIEEIHKQIREKAIYELHEGRRKREENKPKCPICGSTNLKKLSAINRGVSFGVFGFASNKIGKTYECQKCKATF